MIRTICRRAIAAALLGILAGPGLAGAVHAQAAPRSTAPAASAPLPSPARPIVGLWSREAGCGVRNDIFLMITSSCIRWLNIGGENMLWPVTQYEVVPDGIMAIQGRPMARQVNMNDYQTDMISEPGTRVVHRRVGAVLLTVRRLNARGGPAEVFPEEAVWHACD